MQVEGVNYDIDWRKFERGASFFIPCLRQKRARADILVVCQRLRIKILTHYVVFNGVRGLRIWRM